MLVEERVRTARIFLDESDVLFDEGDVLQGSEKVWGAAAHAMMAVAQQRGWPIEGRILYARAGRHVGMGQRSQYESHGSLKRAAAILSEESGDPSIGDRFAVAEKFHINFYHHGMEDFQIAGDRPRVRALVERLLSGYIEEPHPG